MEDSPIEDSPVEEPPVKEFPAEGFQRKVSAEDSRKRFCQAFLALGDNFPCSGGEFPPSRPLLDIPTHIFNFPLQLYLRLCAH